MLVDILGVDPDKVRAFNIGAGKNIIRVGDGGDRNIEIYIIPRIIGSTLFDFFHIKIKQPDGSLMEREIK